MNQELIQAQSGGISAILAEKALLTGDLSGLTTEERLELIAAICKSLGLNPLTRPFDYIPLDGKLVLYAKKDCTDQLRNIRNISVQIKNKEIVDGVYVVVAGATTPDGRTDESIGAVSVVKESGDWKTSQSGKKYFVWDGKLLDLSPDARANAMMKAETKAKRRVTLSICGLGLTDESELETIQARGEVQRAMPQGGSNEAATASPRSSAAPKVADQVPAPLLEMFARMEEPGGVGPELANLTEELIAVMGSEAKATAEFTRLLKAYKTMRWENLKPDQAKAFARDLWIAIQQAAPAPTTLFDDAPLPG